MFSIPFAPLDPSVSLDSLTSSNSLNSSASTVPLVPWFGWNQPPVYSWQRLESQYPFGGSGSGSGNGSGSGSEILYGPIRSHGNSKKSNIIRPVAVRHPDLVARSHQQSQPSQQSQQFPKPQQFERPQRSDRLAYLLDALTGQVEPPPTTTSTASSTLQQYTCLAFFPEAAEMYQYSPFTLDIQPHVSLASSLGDLQARVLIYYRRGGTTDSKNDHDLLVDVLSNCHALNCEISGGHRMYWSSDRYNCTKIAFQFLTTDNRMIRQVTLYNSGRANSIHYWTLSWSPQRRILTFKCKRDKPRRNRVYVNKRKLNRPYQYRFDNDGATDMQVTLKPVKHWKRLFVPPDISESNY